MNYAYSMVLGSTWNNFFVYHPSTFKKNYIKQLKEDTENCSYIVGQRDEGWDNKLLSSIWKKVRYVPCFSSFGCMLDAQSCPTLCDPIYCSLPGFSVHGGLQARILEWVAIPFSRGSSKSRDWIWVSRIAGRFWGFSIWAISVTPAFS